MELDPLRQDLLQQFFRGQERYPQMMGPFSLAEAGTIDSAQASCLQKIHAIVKIIRPFRQRIESREQIHGPRFSEAFDTVHLLE
jgi:hypothetical protein